MIKLAKSRENTNLEKLLFRGKELSKTEKYLPIVGAIGIIATLFLVLIPTVKSISVVRNNIKDTQEKLDKIRNQRRIFENMRKNESAEALQQKMKYANKYLPSQKPSLEVLINISRLSRLKGVQFEGLTISIGNIKQIKKETKDNDEAKLTDFDLEFSIKGKKDKVLAFITDIKEVSPIMKVSDISTKFNETSDMWEASLKIKVYYKGNPKTIPAIDKPIATLTDEEVSLLDSLNNYLLATSYFSDMEDISLDVLYGVENPFGK